MHRKCVILCFPGKFLRPVLAESDMPAHYLLSLCFAAVSGVGEEWRDLYTDFLCFICRGIRQRKLMGRMR